MLNNKQKQLEKPTSKTEEREYELMEAPAAGSSQAKPATADSQEIKNCIG